MARFARLLLLYTAISLACWPALSDAGKAQAVKAVLLYKFTKFITWPPHAQPANAAFRICVFGEDPLVDALDAIAGKLHQQQPIQVTQTFAAQTAVQQCQVLFIGIAEQRRLPALLAALAGKPVLTVSDLPGFAARGGMIELGRERQRIQFIINRHAAQSADLTLSAQLLQVARRVLHGDNAP